LRDVKGICADGKRHGKQGEKTNPQDKKSSRKGWCGWLEVIDGEEEEPHQNQKNAVSKGKKFGVETCSSHGKKKENAEPLDTNPSKKQPLRRPYKKEGERRTGRGNCGEGGRTGEENGSEEWLKYATKKQYGSAAIKHDP